MTTNSRTHTRRSVFTRCVITLMAACAVHAQQTPEVTTPPPTPGDAAKQKETAKTITAAKASATDEEVITLNPFVIESDSDVGYLATQSLAGSRLNTNLKDIANQVQVMTPEFLQDIGAFDGDDAFRYSINTENGYELGGTSTQFFGQGGGTGIAADNRTRGLTGASNTRNFFKTQIPKDNYNSTDSGITIAGGPNAILFGLGSAAGVADTSDDEANLLTYKTTVTLALDSNDSRRYSISSSAPIIKKQLALRVAMLNSRKRFALEPSYENDKRFYGTLSWKIAPNTSFSSKVELVDREANRPVFIFPKDRVTPWLNPGNVGGNSQPFYNLPNAASPGGIFTGWTPTGAPTYTVGGNAASGIYFNRYSTGISAVGQVMDNANSGVPGLVEWNDDGTLLNEAVYPFSKYTPYGLTHPAELNAKRFTQTFSTRLLPNLFFELSHNYEHTRERSVNFRPTDAALAIDPNAYRYKQGYIPMPEAVAPVLQANPTAAQITAYNTALATYNATIASPAHQTIVAANTANRVANENLGELYVEGYQTASRSDFLSKETRASLAYLFDAKKYWTGTWGKMIGTHKISTNASYSLLRARSQNSFFRFIQDTDVNASGYGIAPSVITDASRIDGPTASRYLQPSGNVNADNNRKLVVRAYVNPDDPDHAVASFNGLDPFGTWTFNDINGNPYTTGLYNNGGAGEMVKGRITENTSKAFSWQADILKKYLVITYGKRFDDVRFKRYDKSAAAFDPRTGLFPTYDNMPWIPFTESLTKVNETKAVVFKPLSWLRFHYNESNNNEAEPPDVRDIDGTIYPLPTGTNTDMGFSVDIGNLTLRVNKFENKATWTDAGNTYGNNSLRRTIFELETRYNILNGVQQLAQGLPTTTNFYLSSDTNVGFDTVNYNADNYRIFSDSRSKGLEIELGGRVKKLDVRLTVGRTDSVKTNIGPQWLAYATDPTMLDRMLTLKPYAYSATTGQFTPINAFTNGATGAVTMGTDPITGARVPVVTGITARTNATDPATGQLLPAITGFQNIAYANTGAANQSTTMYNRYVNNVLTDTLRIRQLEGVANPAIREWRANMTLGYSFQSGQLKGLRVGSSFRMREQALIAYKTENVQIPIGDYTVSGFATAIDKPYFNDRQYFVDPFVSYRWRMGRNYTMRVQLNISNVFENSDSYLTNVIAHANNTFDVNDPRTSYYGITDNQYLPMSMTLGEPREFKLSCTLEF